MGRMNMVCKVWRMEIVCGKDEWCVEEGDSVGRMNMVCGVWRMDIVCGKDEYAVWRMEIVFGKDEYGLWSVVDGDSVWKG